MLTKTLSPGAGLGTPLKTEYGYDAADVKWTDEPPSACRGKLKDPKHPKDGYEPCFEQFIGFGTVTEQWKNDSLPGDPILKLVTTGFRDTEGNPQDRLKGKVQSVRVGDPAGSYEESWQQAA